MSGREHLKHWFQNEVNLLEKTLIQISHHTILKISCGMALCGVLLAQSDIPVNHHMSPITYSSWTFSYYAFHARPSSSPLPAAELKNDQYPQMPVFCNEKASHCREKFLISERASSCVVRINCVRQCVHWSSMRWTMFFKCMLRLLLYIYHELTCGD